MPMNIGMAISVFSWHQLLVFISLSLLSLSLSLSLLSQLSIKLDKVSLRVLAALKLSFLIFASKVI